VEVATQRSAVVTPSSLTPVRFASKKATGGNRNKKQAPGQNRGVKKYDGQYVFPGDCLVARQPKFWFHPGLNVTFARKHLHLLALKEGTVRITCEKPDLNWSHTLNQKFYAGRENQTFYKKYYNVIPNPQHTRFKCIDQV